MKFHLKKNGEPGLCTATAKACPRGDAADHYSTAEEARKAFEAKQAKIFTEQKLSPAQEAIVKQVLRDADNARQRIKAAADFSSASMRLLWDRKTRTWKDEELGHFLHEAASAHASAIFKLSSAVYAFKNQAWGEAHEEFAKAETMLHEQGKEQGAEMKKYWDRNSKTWTDEAKGIFFHDLINLQAKALNSARFARRQAGKLMETQDVR